jgi:hypothetical protein
MKVKLFVALAALLGSCLGGCTRVRFMVDIAQVSRSEQSGTISPELQLTEQIVITPGRVTLTRKGRTPDSEVNVGTWEWAVDEAQVRALFAQLQAVDCRSIKRVEPPELDDGGGTESYSIEYGGDKTFTIEYGGGVTYTGGRSIVEPIDAFIASLTFPADAKMQYQPLGDRAVAK